jgi:hypothetical protein
VGLLCKQGAAVLPVLLFALTFGLFILPGFAVALWIADGWQVRVVDSVILAVTVSSFLGYVAFWIYLSSQLMGQVFSIGCIGVAACALVWILWYRPPARVRARRAAVPFLYVLSAGACYVCFFFLFGIGDPTLGDPYTPDASLANVRFFDDPRTIDNQLPLVFAERIWEGGSLKPFCCGGWMSSDRPPLQAGIFLLQRPFAVIGGAGLHYQLLGTVLQCLWIPGVWALLTALGVAERQIKQVLGFLIFSGFLFYNSVYVWPKLLAAAFFLFFLSIVFEILGGNGTLTPAKIMLATSSLSLAMLAHSGSVFSLPGLALILIPRRRVFRIRECALALLVMGLFGAPWLAYQKLYDPPGNRLMKMHIAGAHEIDQRSTWQAVTDGYRDRNLGSVIRAKWANITTLIGPSPIDGLGLNAIGIGDGLHLDHATTEASRIAQREYVWNALGIVNAGWLALLAMILRRQWKARALPYSGFFILAPAINLIVWSMVMFGPGQTFTTHSSYADILLLSIGLLSFLLALHPAVVMSLWAIGLLNLFVVWVWREPFVLTLPVNAALAPMLQLPLLAVGAVLSLGLIFHFGRSYLETDVKVPAAARA